MQRARQQRAAVIAIEGLGGYVSYGGTEKRHGRPLDEGWLRRTLGDDCFDRVTRVAFYFSERQPITDQQLMPHLEALPRLTQLQIRETSLSDSGLAKIADHHGLEVLDLHRVPIGSRALVHLQGLTNLKYLNLARTRIRDEGTYVLSKMKRLQTLYLNSTRIGDATVKHLEDLSGLEELYLTNTEVSDDCIPCLARLKRLKRLDLDFTHISPAGADRLRDALPSCDITHGRTRSGLVN